MRIEDEGLDREVVLAHKLDLYEEYVKSRSFWGDMRLIVQTFIVLVKGQK